MYEVSKQHNDLIDLPLRKFNASEIDIFMAICYKCQNENTLKITLTFDQIQQLTHFRSKNKQELIRAIEETNRKLLQLNFKIGDNINFVQLVLFPTFEVRGSEETLTVQVHEKFAYLLNNLTENYTSLELQQSASLRSSYAKGIYKKLRKYRDTGIWRVSLIDFKEYLDVPNSYRISDINKVVIKPSINELNSYFSGLSCRPYYNKQKKGRGRPAIVGYEFTFKKQLHDKKEKYLSVRQIADRTGWERLGKYCPICHQEVYKKRMSNENGEYWMIGHPDFKTGNCKWITTNFGDALLKSELPDISQSESDQKADEDKKERKENSKRLSFIIKNLFNN